MNNFIHFGCWNNLNEGGKLKSVIHKINNRLRNNTKPRIDFISVAGDNYYPDKIKPVKKTDTKKKLIHPHRLLNGFSKLPNSTDIFMILGNHDLETNTDPQKPKLFIKDEYNGEESEKDCKILTLQKKYSSIRKNINFVLFKELLLSDGTLVMMIDSSMYSVDAEEYLSCYNTFLSSNYTLDELRDYQNRWIYSTLNTHVNTLTNLVIIGHHPISGIKYKREKDKQETLNDIPFFIDVLKEVYKILSDKVLYYYLCADLHSYQKGTIMIDMNPPIDDSNVIPRMMINQHIVGTGGTKLDDDIPETITKTVTNDIITYKLLESQNKHGFLECNVGSNGLDFIFHGVDIPSASKTNKTRKKSQKRNSRKKTSRIN